MAVRVSGGFGNEWNVYTSTGQFAVLLVQNILNNITFIEPTDGSTTQPDLAERFSVTSDGKRITYNVRAGVTWHDGKPFTAKDIAYSIDLARNPKDPAAAIHKSRLSKIAAVEAPDDATVRVTLSAPSASMLTFLSISNLVMYPAHIPDIAQWKANPVGTGPFKFKSLQPSTQSEMVRNPNYFKKDAGGQALPYLDGLTYVWITDQALAFSAFRTGRLTCACGYSSDILVSQRQQAADAIPGVKFGTAWSVNYMFYNSKGPLANQKVRQAIHIGFDRIVMRDILRGGTAFYPPTYFVPRANGGKLALPEAEVLKLPGFREPKQQDTDLAKRLLQEAGIDPSTITITIAGNDVQKDINEGVGSLIQALGFKVNIRALGTVDRTAVLRRGDFDLGFSGGGNSFDDPQDLIGSYVQTGGFNNFGKWSNPKIDQLLAAQDAELDPAKRTAIVQDLQREMLDFAIAVPIHTFPQLYAVAPFVENFPLQRVFVVGAAHRFERVWFNK